MGRPNVQLRRAATAPGALRRPATSLPGSRHGPPRIQQLVRRRALVRRSLAVGAGVVAVLATRSIGPGRAPAPSSVHVAVAVRDLSPGETVGPDDVVTEGYPAGLVPGAAGDPVGRVVTASIFAGEVLADTRLGPAGSLGLAPGERAVGMIRPRSLPPIRAGQLVELVAVTAGPAGAGSQSLGPAARVISIDDETVTIAVPAELAPLVVELGATGSIELVGTPFTE